MIKLRSRKGVSGAISAMFVIAIFFIIVVSLFVYTGMLNSYNQVVNERSKMDWERNSEHVTFISAQVGADGILRVSFSNDGRVMLHLVQVWFTEFPDNSYDESIWQMQYWINKYVSPGETVNDLGYYPEFKIINSGSIGDLTSLSDLNSQYYKIKLVTERGNAFVCQVPWPVSEGGGGAIGGYVLQIDNDYGNFQYAFGENPAPYKSAFVKNPTVVPTMYRILIKNITEKDIIVLSNSTMLQMYGGVGAVQNWYIVKAPTDESGESYLPLDPTLWSKKNERPPPRFDPYPNGQLIPAKASKYLYFAASSVRGDSWQLDPSAGGEGYVLVSCVLSFRYDGETEVRNVPTPAIVQDLKP